MWNLVLVLTTGTSRNRNKKMVWKPILISPDLIPLRDVASWLGYINIVSTTGRSIGGPLGGFLADRIGWRW